MTNVIFVISMSLDGYIAAANRTPDEPMGQGGERLHEWMLNSDDMRNREILSRGIGGIGAVISGRRTYDDSLKWWGADGPTGAARVPLFVVTHHAPADVPANGVYTFVDGIEAALAQAKSAAGDNDISVMGGANIAQQFIRAGLVDEIQIHLVPVLFGAGTRLFEHIGTDHIELESIEVIETRDATHLRYRVLK